MPIPPINIPADPSDYAHKQVRETLRLLVQQFNDQEIKQAAIARDVASTLREVKRFDSIAPAPSSQLERTANAIQQQQLTGNVTGLIGLLAQGQYTLVPQYLSTPSLSDPAVINGSLYLDNATGHLWYIDHSVSPVTFLDLTAIAMSSALAASTRAAKPAASASNQNTFYFETDSAWLYYSTGSAWSYIAGVYYGTRATRTGLTISTADNNAIFYETDYKLYWQVVAGAWTNITSGTISVNITPVSVNAASTAAQNLMSYSVPAGLLNVVGKTLRITCSGLYDIDTAVNVTWTIKLGSVTILSWTPQTPAGVKTDLPFRISAELITSAIGATGTLEAHGLILPENKITAGHQPVPQLDLNTAASGAIDLTGANTLQVTVAFDTSSTANLCEQRVMILEILN